MAIEIVDFPINSMVIFQFAMLNYQRVMAKAMVRDRLVKFLLKITSDLCITSYNLWGYAWL